MARVNHISDRVTVFYVSYCVIGQRTIVDEEIACGGFIKMCCLFAQWLFSAGTPLFLREVDGE